MKILESFKKLIRPDNWEIYLPIEDSNEVLLLRPICTKCGKYWSVDRKECFDCKAKYFRVKQCPTCGTLYPENAPNCSKGHTKTKTKKKCLSCGKIDEGREVAFVPNTFCNFCGNRQNRFEYKIVDISEL